MHGLNRYKKTKAITRNQEQCVTTDFFNSHIMDVLELVTCKEMNCSNESIRKKIQFSLH